MVDWSIEVGSVVPLLVDFGVGLYSGESWVEVNGVQFGELLVQLLLGWSLLASSTALGCRHVVDMNGLSGYRPVVNVISGVKQKAKLKGEMNSNEIVMRT